MRFCLALLLACWLTAITRAGDECTHHLFPRLSGVANTAHVSSEPTAGRVQPSDIKIYPSYLHDAVINPDPDLAAYKDARTVLMLADGPPEAAQAPDYTPLAERVAKKFPETKVVKADVGFKDTDVEGNLTTMHLDNTKDFPLEPNSFDMIVMRRGLCICNDGMCCAGIHPRTTEAKQFLVRVALALNKKKPGSTAYLMNDNKGKELSLTVWREAAAMAMSEVPGIRIDLYRGASGGFDGVRIVAVGDH